MNELDLASQSLDDAGSTSKLAPLLDPESLVIIGASPNFQRTGGIPIETLIKGGFPREKLLLVNPKYREIAGLPCLPSIEALPWVPDLAVLAIRASETLGALRQCHARGIRAAAIFASGFAEEGGEEARQAQSELTDFARESGMVISGPNCLGHVNFRKRVFATFLKNMAVNSDPGPVAILAQSGNMAAVLRKAGLDAGLRFSYLVNTGNEACIDFSEYLEHLAADAETGAVLGYVEQIRDGRRFMEVASRMQARGKPLFLIKAGNSDKGAEATASHTAAMAGSSRSYAAAFAQLGIATTSDPYRLVDLAYLWKTGKRPGGKRVCVVSVSGAGCALIADQFSAEGIEVPTLGTATQSSLRSVVPSYGMVSNPVDLTGQVTNDSAFFPVVLDAMAACPDVDAVVFYVMGYLLDQMAPDLVRVAKTSDKLMVVIDTAVGAASHPALEAAGVAVFEDMNRAISATSTYLRWSSFPPDSRWQPARPRQATNAGTGPGKPVPEEVLIARGQRRDLLSEVEAKALLARAGLPMVQEIVASDAAEAARIAGSLGFPVVAKIVSPDIAHKSDIGGVQLNLGDTAAVSRAFTEIVERTGQAKPEARIEGVVIQPMVSGGQPVLLAVVRDPVFGPMMTVGLGGVLTELYVDLAQRVLPVDAATAASMLRELRCYPLLTGYRGAEPADLDALVQLMTRLSEIALDLDDCINELELNPVQVLPRGRGVVAVDALVRLLRT
jgi:acyl-CoA synthetase (NDP forming)